MARLGDVVSIKQGVCSGNSQIWLLNLDKIEPDTGNIIEYTFVDKDSIGASVCQFDNRNVLYSKLRPYLNKVVVPEKSGYATSELVPLFPKSKILNRYYLAYFLRSKKFVEYISSKVAGAKMPRADMKAVLNAEIPLYTISKQHEIVKLFNFVEQLIALRKQQLSKLDQFVKARFIEMFGEPDKNTFDFEMASGKNLFKFSSGKFLSDEKRLQNGIPVYGGNGIAWYTDEALIDYPTLVIGRVGAYCGNVRRIDEPVWITDNAIYIKEFKTSNLTLEFLFYLMKFLNFSQFADFSGQPKITQKPLENTLYIIPPLPLQEEFAAFVQKVDKTKTTVKQSLEKLETLKKSLMQEYFG